MFKAMVIKELREVRGIALIALAIFAYVVLGMVKPAATLGLPGPEMFMSRGQPVADVPFVTDGFEGSMGFYFFLTAIALGLKQTLGESVRGTYVFLLHRPASRRWLIGTKLFVGLSVYLVCGAMPILAYGCWAASHSMLFEWSMTLRCWKILFCMTLPYVAAFLTGFRPGRWYASRLFPLAAVAPFLLLVEVDGLADLTPLWECVAFAIFDIWMMAAIFIVMRNRDFS